MCFSDGVLGQGCCCVLGCANFLELWVEKKLELFLARWGSLEKSEVTDEWPREWHQVGVPCVFF